MSAKRKIATAPDSVEPTIPEKRLRQFIRKPTAGLRDRIVRALSQRMFLLNQMIEPVSDNKVNDNNNSKSKNKNPSATSQNCAYRGRIFAVLGSTGNVYDVRISLLPSCTCPDHLKGNLCKHIIFVMVRVLGVPKDSPLASQKAYLSSELSEMFDTFDSRGNQQTGSAIKGSGGVEVLANERAIEAFRVSRGIASPNANSASSSLSSSSSAAVEQEPLVDTGDEDDDCPICFEPIVVASTTTDSSPTAAKKACTEALERCGVCRICIHAQCIKQWRTAKRVHVISCPCCRSDWVNTHPNSAKPTVALANGAGGAAGVVQLEGYTNLGALQGLPKNRSASVNPFYRSYSGGYRQNEDRRHYGVLGDTETDED